MKKLLARDLYPDEEEGYSMVADYTPIIQSLGKVYVRVDDEDYQGDSRILFRGVENYKLGFLLFGWGSCSGCDSLQACSTFSEIDELIQELKDKIIWFDSKEIALDYFKTHDWEGDYTWCDSGTRKFIDMCIIFLSKAEER